MIKDKLSTLFTNSNTPKRVSTTSPEVKTGQNPSSGSSGSAVTLSPEAGRAEESSPRLNNLLGGLGSWGSEDTGKGNGTNGTNGTNGAAGGWDQVLKSGQMPMSIINQVFSTLKNAGGMATAGALHSLLSWGAAEKKKTGKIREEFQSILREAVEFAKKNKVMSEEDLAKYESKLFGGGDGEGGKGGKSSHPKKWAPKLSAGLRGKLGQGK